MRLETASWYLHRLSRMHPVEVAHRVIEYQKRQSDRRRAFGWRSFTGFGGQIIGLPGLKLEAADSSMMHAATVEFERMKAGQLHWLGCDWPALDDDWPETFWTLDPVTDSHWPGAGNPRASYRDANGRGDVKFVWEPNRLQMLQPLALLAANGDASAAAFAFRVLKGWMAANPPYDGINWSSGIETASRVVSVLVLQAGAGPFATDDDSSRLRAFLQAHQRQLARYPSLHSSSNNHRIAELGALLLLGICATGLDDSGVAPAGILAELEQEVTRQFHSDGVGAEQSPTYAAYTLEWFALAAIAAEAAGLKVSAVYRERTGLAADLFDWLSDDTGRPPRLGDDDEGRVLALTMEPESRYPASVAALTSRWLGRPQAPTRYRDPALRDLLAPRLQEVATGWVAPQGERTFEAGGMTVVRDTRSIGTTVLTVDHGPLGFLSIAAHGHADALSVLLSWGEESVFVDAGTYLYHSGGRWRDQLRGTGAHNTVQIENEDQSRIIGPFAWANHAATSVVVRAPGRVVAACNGWKTRFGVAHERCVDWSAPGRVQIEDRLVGVPVRPLEWTSGITLAPGCIATPEGDRADVLTPAGRRLTLTAAKGYWRAVEAPYSPRFNHLVSTTRLELSGRLQGSSADPIAAFSWVYAE